MEMTDELKEQYDRFLLVIARRKTLRELLDLVGSLAVSTRFTESAKPVLYGPLLKAILPLVQREHVRTLLSTLKARRVPEQLRAGYSEDEADVLLAKLVQRVLELSPGEAGWLSAIEDLQMAGVCVDRGQVLGYAQLSGMPSDVLDEICDSTYAFFYLPKAA